MRNILIICYLLLSTVFFKCANQRPPTGGDKDEDSPELVSATPADQTLNYSGKEIVLEFNEAIKLNSPKEQILVTPRLTQEYEIKYRKERVIISFEAPLADSTTYTFNFREAIQDLNEGNPAENLKLSFSTGDYLDSLKITGSTNNILTNKAIKDVTVSLYPIGDTLDPFQHPPIYFTKTEKDGSFEFNNIKNGKYFIIALKDKNKNLFIDAKNEYYGFLTDTLDLTNNIDSLYIPLQRYDTRLIALQSSRQAGTVFQLKMNKFTSDYQLITEDSSHLTSNFVDAEHQTIQIFNHNFTADSLHTILISYDTTYASARDTLYVKFEPTARSPKKLESNMKLEPIVPSEGVLSAKLKFNKPIDLINFDSIYIYLDSANIIFLDSTHFTINKYRDEFQVNYVLDPALFEEKKDSTQAQASNTPNTKTLPGTKPTGLLKSDTTKQGDNPKTKSNQKNTSKQTKPYLSIQPNSFISIEQDSSERLKSNLEFKKLSSFASLLIEIQPEEGQHFIVQLLNKNYEVLREEKDKKEIKFTKLLPGDYRIRVIIDENGNGRWDPAYFDKRTSPERIIYFVNSENQETITLRANWEVGPNIIKL